MSLQTGIGRRRIALLSSAVLFSVTLVVVLGIQSRTLQSELRVQRHRALFPTTGHVVPPVRATLLSGDSVLIGEGAERTRQVVFVFNTTCPLCIQTLPAWNRLNQRLLQMESVSVLGWSQHADSLTRSYVADHGLTFPTVVNVPLKYLKMYHVLGVPATLVLNHEGTVLYARPGILSPEAEDSVLMATGVLQ